MGHRNTSDSHATGETLLPLVSRVVHVRRQLDTSARHQGKDERIRETRQRIAILHTAQAAAVAQPPGSGGTAAADLLRGQDHDAITAHGRVITVQALVHGIRAFHTAADITTVVGVQRRIAFQASSLPGATFLGINATIEIKLENGIGDRTTAKARHRDVELVRVFQNMQILALGDIEEIASAKETLSAAVIIKFGLVSDADVVGVHGLHLRCSAVRTFGSVTNTSRGHRLKVHFLLEVNSN